jgi:CMP/dCMP kinase
MLPFKPNLIIAIDGYSSCGKSTFAKMIAAELNYIYIDSGAMYRAVTLAALERGIIQDGAVQEDSLPEFLDEVHISFHRMESDGNYQTFLNGKNVEKTIRQSRAVSENVSFISTYRMVRDKMVQMQRKIGSNGRIVMDGRDIGTVVFPNADIKIFMTADPRIRAQRRFDELVEKGLDVDFDSILENILERDEIDQNRKESPLKKADDALVLNNSYLTPEEQLHWFMELLANKGFDSYNNK